MDGIKLSILILTTPDRLNYLTNLLAILKPQVIDGVEIIIEEDNFEKTIGQKRNNAIEKAKGDYIAFIDSDDEVSSNYVKLILEAINTNPDCCSLKGVITWDGNNPEVFEHSLKYSVWKTNTNNEAIKYERPPNHLNAIKRDIAIKYDFIPVNHGEDQEWSMRIKDALTTERSINEVIYHYKYRSNK
jgi:glycosyltransferase involved in cell wall biosynthesis